MPRRKSRIIDTTEAERGGIILTAATVPRESAAREATDEEVEAIIADLRSKGDMFGAVLIVECALARMEKRRRH